MEVAGRPVVSDEEGCRLVVRLVRRRPLTWTLQWMCPVVVEGRVRWRFMPRLPIYACCTVHWGYCSNPKAQRYEKKRLEVDAIECELFNLQCIGPRPFCEEELRKRLEDMAWSQCPIAFNECHLQCFGVGPHNADEWDESIHFRSDPVEVCCMTRCDMCYRCRDLGECPSSYDPCGGEPW